MIVSSFISEKPNESMSKHGFLAELQSLKWKHVWGKSKETEGVVFNMLCPKKMSVYDNHLVREYIFVYVTFLFN